MQPRYTTCAIARTRTRSFGLLTAGCALLLMLASCGVNRNVYKSADFEQQAARHKTVAILPFRIIQTGHLPKGTTEEQVRTANEKMSVIFQESLHSYALRQTARNRKGLIVAFQSTEKTNALLKEAGLNTEGLYAKTPEEIAALLGVDAVLMTSMENNRNFSDGVAYGLAAGRVLLGVLSKNPTVLPGTNASDVNMNSTLHDARTGKLLWKTFRAGGTDLPANVDGLVEYYSNWIAKKLPYRS